MKLVNIGSYPITPTVYWVKVGLHDLALNFFWYTYINVFKNFFHYSHSPSTLAVMDI